MAGLLAAVVPCRDEGRAVGGVVTALRASGCAVVVVDNGSRDDTADAASRAGAHVTHERRRGYGAAAYAGVTACPEACPGATRVVFVAGDGQDDPAKSIPILREAERRLRDVEQPLPVIVVGDRTSTPQGRAALTLPQQIGNALACSLIAVLWGRVPLVAAAADTTEPLRFLTDLGPLRLLPLDTLHALRMEDRSFGWTVEMSIKVAAALADAGVNSEPPPWVLAEEPVPYAPRRHGVTKISGTLRGSAEAGAIILATVAKHYARHVARAVVGTAHVTPAASEQSPPVRARLVLATAGVLVVAGAAAFSANLDASGDADAPRRTDATNTPVLTRFLCGVGAACIGYVAALVVSSRHARAVSARAMWTVALAARLMCLCAPAEPSLLGDDINRYMFEGLLVSTYGISPYGTAPSAMAQTVRQGGNGWTAAPRVWRERIFAGINHPDTSSVYGPLAELLFATAASIAPSPLLLRLLLTSADTAVAWLLARRFGPARALTYAWSPLVLLATASGGHVDAFMLLFATAAFLACVPGPSDKHANPHVWPAVVVLLGLACAVKWVPLVFLPFAALYAGLAPGAAPASGYGVLLVRAYGVARVHAHFVWRTAVRVLAALVLFACVVLAAYAMLFAWVSASAIASGGINERTLAVRPGAVDGSDWVATAHVASFLPALLDAVVPSLTRTADGKPPHNAAWFAPFVISGAALGAHELAWCYRHWRRLGDGTAAAAGRPVAVPVGLERLPLVAEDLILLLLMCSPVVHFWYFSWGIPLAVVNQRPAFAVAGVTACLYFLRYASPLGTSGGDISAPLRLALYVPVILARLGVPLAVCAVETAVARRARESARRL